MTEDTRTNEQIVADALPSHHPGESYLVTAALAAAGRLVTPPIGYLVIAKRPHRTEPATVAYDPQTRIILDRETVENWRLACEEMARDRAPFGADVEYIVAAIREDS